MSTSSRPHAPLASEVGARRLVAAVVAVLVLAACSGDERGERRPDRDRPTTTRRSTTTDTPTTDTPTTTRSTTTSTAAKDDTDEPTTRKACRSGSYRSSVTSKPVAGKPSDHTITSFDGTPIRAHWFSAKTSASTRKAPTVLMGPGWSMAGDVADTGDDGATAPLGALSISSLHRAGYHVLTWDPRGFGASGGKVTVNDPRHEGRDVRVLLDWVASRPEVLLDHEGDPRVGMVGMSYGGGIQLTTAANDCRIDALVPMASWYSLRSSLYKASTVKAGWSGVLVGFADATRLDPHVTRAAKEGKLTGTIRPADVDWFESRGPGRAVDRITAPTLLVQGTVDTLFTLHESSLLMRSLTEREVPSKLLWYCGGHGVCLTGGDERARVQRAMLRWLDRYVKRDETVDTGPAFEAVDQLGAVWSGNRYPVRSGTPITAVGTGTLKLLPTGGSGPYTGPIPADQKLLGPIVAPFTPTKAANAVTVKVPPPRTPTLVLGAPRLRLRYRGKAGSGDAPTRAFAQLVDAATGRVVGNQITPISLTLDGRSHVRDAKLEIVVHHLGPTRPVNLQLVATTPAYGPTRIGGEIEFEEIQVSLPTTEGLQGSLPRP